jgi:hypothetical protein
MLELQIGRQSWTALKFRVDTGSDFSVLPGKWFFNQANAAHHSRSAPIGVNTVSGLGTTTGELVRLHTRIPHSQKDFRIDYLVCSSLEGESGLFSLRDLHDYFHFKNAGPFASQFMLGRIELNLRSK